MRYKLMPRDLHHAFICDEVADAQVFISVLFISGYPLTLLTCHTELTIYVERFFKDFSSLATPLLFMISS